MIARIKLLLPIFFLLAIMAQPAMSAQKTGAPVQKAPENNGKPMVLDMVMGDPEDSEMGILGIAFKNYISQASKGQLEIQLANRCVLAADPR